MKNRNLWAGIIVIGLLFLPYTINFGLVGYSMSQSFAQRSVGNKPFTWVDSTTGRSYTGTLIATGPSYEVPEGYHRSGPVRCNADQEPAACTAGTAADLVNAAGHRITIYTHPTAVYQDQFRTNHTILPFVVVGPVPPRTSLLTLFKSNEAWAVFGDVGGPIGVDNNSAVVSEEIVNIINLGNGDYLIGLLVTYSNGSMQAVVQEINVPGGILI